jgi:ethanolamine permease
MYILSMASLFKLRMSEPKLERSYRAPLYPLFPAIALLGAVVCLLTMLYYNRLVGGVFIALLVLGYLYFRTTKGRRGAVPAGSQASVA